MPLPERSCKAASRRPARCSRQFQLACLQAAGRTSPRPFSKCAVGGDCPLKGSFPWNIRAKPPARASRCVFQSNYGGRASVPHRAPAWQGSWLCLRASGRRTAGQIPANLPWRGSSAKLAHAHRCRGARRIKWQVLFRSVQNVPDRRLRQKAGLAAASWSCAERSPGKGPQARIRERPRNRLPPSRRSEHIPQFPRASVRPRARNLLSLLPFSLLPKLGSIQKRSSVPNGDGYKTIPPQPARTRSASECAVSTRGKCPDRRPSPAKKRCCSG